MVLFFGVLLVFVGIPVVAAIVAKHTLTAEEKLAAETLQGEHDAGLIDFTPTEAQEFAEALEIIDSWESGRGETLYATEQYRPRLQGGTKHRVAACLTERPRCETAAGRWEQAVIEAMVEADRRELIRRTGDGPSP